MPRLVVPDYPHHVIQRGNRRQNTFFCEADFRTYRRLLAIAKATAGVEVWAYCLMPNHVHLIAVPSHRDSLAALFGNAHRRYTRFVNERQQWRGHLWQERFHSSVLDEPNLFATVRYVELNPVRAGLCRHAEGWRWSSVHAHMRGRDDILVRVQPMLEQIGDWDTYLRVEPTPGELNRIRRHAKTGRPLGSPDFVRNLKRLAENETPD